MTLIEATESSMSFRTDAAEKQAWCDLLKLYPLQSCVIQPPDQANAADEQMLAEALASHRRENSASLKNLHKRGGGFVPEGAAFKLTLKPSQVETLLQVLNDLRVGSWQALGCPDRLSRKQVHPTEPDFRHVWVMEVAGHFQMALLEGCSAARPD